jgi:hypothetical protein
MARSAASLTGHTAARPLLVVTLAASAGVHAALVPAHATGGVAVAILFAASSGALASAAVLVDRHHRPGAVVGSALLLAALLAAYALARVIPVWPLEHSEPVDALGAATKAVEAAGLLLALRLLQDPAGNGRSRPLDSQELAHEYPLG